MKSSKQTPKIDPSDLVTINELYKQLGRGFSRTSIRRRIAEGEWVEGTHYLDCASPNGRQRSIKLILPAIMEWLATPIAKR